MKYERNSRYKKDKQLTKRETKELLSKVQIREVADKLVDDVQWLEQLEQIDKFSSEWVHTVAVELLMQCMGKKSIVMGVKGSEIVLKVFKEKQALKTLEMIAKMNGHLVDIVKGSITHTTQGTIEHKVELVPDASKTEQVFDILESCGVFPNEPKKLTKADVTVISA